MRCGIIDLFLIWTTNYFHVLKISKFRDKSQFVQILQQLGKIIEFGIKINKMWRYARHRNKEMQANQVKAKLAKLAKNRRKDSHLLVLNKFSEKSSIRTSKTGTFLMLSKIDPRIHVTLNKKVH